MSRDGQALSHIVLHSLWRTPHHPVRLLGAFEGDELVFASAPDMGLEWWRGVNESPAAFERRLVLDICEARGAVPPRLSEEDEAALEPPADAIPEKQSITGRSSRIGARIPGNRGWKPEGRPRRKVAASN